MKKLVEEYYRLDENNNPRICNIYQWSEFMNNPRRIVAVDHFEDSEVRISTVFLGIDHGFFETEPVLFETMIFAPGKDYDQRQWRCCTWKEAVAQHAEARKLAHGGEGK